MIAHADVPTRSMSLCGGASSAAAVPDCSTLEYAVSRCFGSVCFSRFLPEESRAQISDCSCWLSHSPLVGPAREASLAAPAVPAPSEDAAEGLKQLQGEVQAARSHA